MSSTYTRVMATLSNGQSVYAYNMDVSAKLDAPVIMASLPEPRENAQGNLEYRFSDADSGFFCSIRADDTARLDAVREFDGNLLIKVTPLRSFSSKDFEKATAFGGAK